MPSLSAQQKQIAIDAIIHMEGTDGSYTNEGPAIPGWGGKGSALSYGQFQDDISQGENKYDIMSNSQALLEMLEYYNYDRSLDQRIVASASTPIGAKGIIHGHSPADLEYNNVISSALSAPENLSFWQTQDNADKNIVIDKLNEAINYINDKNPAAAGALSWSHLDPKALMALAAWTNQHQNIMPMIEALTKSASAKKPLSSADLLNGIFQQPYFQGPKAYSHKDWQKRIDDTVQYVNHKENNNFNDFGPATWLVPSAYGDTLPNGTDSGYLPSAANSPARAVDTHPQTAPNDQAARPAAEMVEPAAGHGMAWDMQDAYASVLAYVGGAPPGEGAPDWSVPPTAGVMQLHDQMTAIGKAMFEAERRQASFLEAHGAGLDIPANHSPNRNARAVPDAMKPNEQTIALAKALYEAIHKEAPTPAAQGASMHRRNGPTGHRHDPIFIYSNEIAGNTRMPNR